MHILAGSASEHVVLFNLRDLFARSHRRTARGVLSAAIRCLLAQSLAVLAVPASLQFIKTLLCLHVSGYEEQLW